MDVTKIPPASVLPVAGALPDSVPGTVPGTAPPAETVPAVLVDRVDIHTLELASALQILVAEARVEFGLPLGAVTGSFTAPSGPADAVAQTARQLLQLLLHDDAAPAPAQAQVPTPEVLRLEATLRIALDRGIDAVAAWRDVPTVVVDAAKDTRELVLTLLVDEPPSPLWFQVEWLALAPRMQRYWRRRRRGGRLSDPDARTPRQHDAPDEPAT